MSLTALAPCAVPYQEPLCRHLSHESRRYPRFTGVTGLPPIDGNVHHAWEQVQRLITQLANREIPGVGRLARIEFIQDLELGAEGVVLFDSYGHPIVHVVPVRLSCRGPRLDLARKIAEALNVPAELFGDAVDIAQRGGGFDRHILILSRQEHYLVNGEDRAEPSDHVTNEWTLWDGLRAVQAA